MHVYACQLPSECENIYNIKPCRFRPVFSAELKVHHRNLSGTVYIIGGSQSYLTGLKSVFCAILGAFFSQKIILHKLKFNPQEFKLNIEKLGKLRKLQYLKKNYEFSDVQFNMSSI